MASPSLRITLLIIIACGVVFTSLQLNVLRYVRDDPKSDDVPWKPNTLVDEQYTWSKTLVNKIHRHRFESAFPFEDESIDEYRSTVRTDHDRGTRNDVKRGQKNDSERTIVNDSTSPRINTFFSSLKIPFKDVPIGQGKSIPTLRFLDACRETIQLFANMNRKILNRVVADVQGNIEKIQRKYDTLPEESSTLQSMVLYDIEQLRINNNDEEYLDTTSIILALEWLVRAFQFISRFLVHICEGEEQTQSARNAYEETLRKHHGFAVRALFKAAFLTLSTRTEFFKEIATSKADLDRPDFEEIAMTDIRGYNIALVERLKIIEEFFLENDIEV